MITITSAYCTYYHSICLYLTVTFGTNDKKLSSTTGIITDETWDNQINHGEAKTILGFTEQDNLIL
jgi:hypothetical protein